jgi:hypothetical protein
MIAINSRVIHEREISKNLNVFKKIKFNELDYELTNNIFDPTKSSPPNDFMIKLKKRIEMFYSSEKSDD